MSTQAPLLARFARPRTDEPTRIAVLSDLHLSLDESGTWRVSHRTEERLEATVRSLNAQDLDAVFFNGDLVQSGRRAQFEAFDRIASDIEVPFAAIPGNHDLIERTEASGTQLTLPEFESRYVPGGLPYRERIGGLDLIGLNSNSSTHDGLGDTYRGELSEANLDWLADVLPESDAPLVFVHHTMDPVREVYRRERDLLPIENGGSPGFANSDALLAILEDHNAPLVVTGHVHFPAVAQAGPVREFTLPSLGPFPCGYTVFDVDERGTTARFHSVADVDHTIEALGHGLDQDRVLLAAARLGTLPLVDDLSPRS